MAIDDIASLNPKIDKSNIPDDLIVFFVPMQAVGAGNRFIATDQTKPAKVENINQKTSIVDEMGTEI